MSAPSGPWYGPAATTGPRGLDSDLVERSIRPSVVLIDVGDTMAKAHPSWLDVYATVFDRYHIETSQAAFEQAFRAAWGEWAHEGPFEATEAASFRRLTELDQLVFDRLGYPNLPEAFFRDIDRAFRRRSAFHVFPDVIPALDAMQAAGLRLGVVSNWGWYAPELLQTLDLARHFEVMSISARVGYQKPHAAIFEHALDLFGVGPEVAIHVGDDPEADVLGARRAGIEPVLIDRHGRIDTPVGAGVETGEVSLIHDFGDLLDLLGIERPAASTGGQA